MNQKTTVFKVARKTMRPPTAEEIAAEARQFFGSPEGPAHREQYGKNYWETRSHRLGRNVSLYGDLRYDHWVLVESNPQIVWYTERPTRFRVRMVPLRERVAWRAVFCRFDMVVQWRDYSIECRRILDERLTASDPDRERLIEAEREWCKAKGFRYLLLTPDDIERQREFIKCWKTILPRLPEATPEYDEDLLRVVARAGECTLDDLCQLFSRIERNRVRACVFCLLHAGHLVSPNLHQEVLFSTIIVRINHE